MPGLAAACSVRPIVQRAVAQLPWRHVHESLTTGLVDALGHRLRCTVTVMGPSKIHYGGPFVGRVSFLLGDPLACLGSVQECLLIPGSVSTTNSSSLIRTKIVTDAWVGCGER